MTWWQGMLLLLVGGVSDLLLRVWAGKGDDNL